MSALITIPGVGECTSRCYNASKTEECRCAACGGALHGLGAAEAERQAPAAAKRVREALGGHVTVVLGRAQLDLFGASGAALSTSAPTDPPPPLAPEAEGRAAFDGDAQWVVVYDASRGDLAYTAECLRCGKVQKPPPLPCDVDVLLAVWRVFAGKHRHCPPPQLELP